MNLLEKVSRYVAGKIDKGTEKEDIFKMIISNPSPELRICYKRREETIFDSDAKRLASELIERDKVLVRTAKYLKNMLDVKPEIILRLDKDCRVLFASKSVGYFFGVNCNDILNKRITDIKNSPRHWNDYTEALCMNILNVNEKKTFADFSLDFSHDSVIDSCKNICLHNGDIPKSDDECVVVKSQIYLLYKEIDDYTEYLCATQIDCPFRNKCISSALDVVENKY